MRHRIAAAAAAASLALTGCSGASEGDATACETFTDAHNAMHRTLYDGTDGDTVRALVGALPGRVESALLVAESPQLRVELDTLSRLANALQGGNDDTGTAYFLQAGTVIETCNDVGVDVEAYEPPE